MNERREELDGLLVRQALEGLDAEESRRLDELLAAYPQVDAEWVDRIVGEVDAATVDDSAHPLDGALREQLLETGPSAAGSSVHGVPRSSGGAGGGSRSGQGWVGWAGWGMAAALAGLLMLQNPSTPAVGSGVDSDVGAAAAPARTVDGSATMEGPEGGPRWDGRPTFEAVAETEDAVLASWGPGGHSSGDQVAGQVVWSGARQLGVMRLAGLEPNPAGLQYQLWIFDARRDERFPVDGGVFDVPAGAGLVEVAVDARLRVDDPTLFAVTLEPTGGVVVSDRTRLATVATVSD